MRLCTNYRLIGLLCLVTANIIFGGNVEETEKSLPEHVRVDGKASAESDPELPVVRLENGPTIIGTVGVAELNQKYFSFRGIPYAQPPIGLLRFKPPVPLSDNYSQVTINATEDGSPCVQAIIPAAFFGSENCLYINVYTPQFPGKNVALPVMVWVYGGAFILGDSRYITYGPDYFMDEGNVMIVTFNYRVGIFGFLSTEDYASPGNYGLKDQLLALKWVQQNIRYFGGNPDQVTLFGESAGAGSISYLTQSPLTKGLFHRVILESGTSLNLWTLTRKPRSFAKVVAANLNIAASNSQVLVDDLRKINYKNLQLSQTNSSILDLLLENPLDGLAFGPVVEPVHDGAIVVNKSYEQLANGLFQRVPYLIGYNSLEAITFVGGFTPLLLKLANYILGPTTLVPASLNVHGFKTAKQANAEIKRRYFGATPTNVTDAELLQFVSDDEFDRPILEAAMLYSQYVPLYLYRFSYEGYLGSGNRTYRGVGHAEELPYIWKSSSYNRTATPSDLLTRKRMIKLWTNFAITGNPTPVSDSVLQNVKWPKANTAGKDNLVCLDIGNNLLTVVNPNRDQFKFWHQIFDKYGNPPYGTY